MRELYQLQDPLILEISGKDAKRYLNARLTNNIKDLAVGGSCIAGMLNPQGRTEGIFTVLHRNEGEYIAYCDGGEHQRILTALKRYIVADRVKIQEMSPSWGVLHVFGKDTVEGLIMIPAKRSDVIGSDLVGEKSSLASVPGTRLNTEAYTIKRVRAGIVSFPDELNENCNFAEADLEDAVSFTKGCYVGQEVIEKVNAFGKIPRKIISKIIKGAVPAIIEGEKIITSVYDKTTDETLMFVSVARI